MDQGTTQRTLAAGALFFLIVVLAACEAAVESDARCMSDADCPTATYCDFPDDLCGRGEMGACTPKLEMCGDHPASTCLCDGTLTYASCVGNTTDRDSDASNCSLREDEFICEDVVCTTKQICEAYPTGGYCQYKSSPCSEAEDMCACLLDTRPDCTCTIEDGNYRLQCPN